MKITFGSLQLCKALINLGFSPEKQGGTSHQKWTVPKNRKLPLNSRTFIEVIQGRKQFYPPSVSGYMRQLRQLGFTTEEILNAFK